MGKQMKRCVICGAAPFCDVQKLKALLKENDVVVAADGGCRLAQALGVIPAVTVADFDSSEKTPVITGECVQLPIKKDVTDTYAAMDLMFSRGYREFLLLGCLGGRFDHSVAALLAARQMTERGCKVTLADENNELTVLLPDTYALPCGSFSVFAMSEMVEGLTLCGVQYPLQNFTLESKNPLCVSNVAIQDTATVSFENGVLLLCRSKD